MLEGFVWTRVLVANVLLAELRLAITAFPVKPTKKWVPLDSTHIARPGSVL